MPVVKQTHPKLVHSAEQWKSLELLASVNCSAAQRDTVCSACSEKAYHFCLNYQMGRFIMANFDLLNTPGASFDALTSSVYQIVSTHTVNTQHGQLVILSLQKADGCRCIAWACGMLMKELLQNPMLMVTSVICSTYRVENE